MTTVRDLHSEAMQLAQLAMVARHQGDMGRAQELARRAYDLEAQAVELVPEEQTSEPTLSILYRSAASLAYQCGDYEVAQRQIARGLSGYPPPEIERELKDLLERIDFELHLQSRGIFLEDAELEVSMEGKAVGAGTVLLSEVTDRLQHTHKLIDRTVWRLMGRAYQRAGRPPSAYRPWTPVLSAPRAGSFIISIKLGTPDKQQMPLLLEASQVIDEIVKGVELVDEANEDALRKMIGEEGYYRNFVELTTAIAPDGENISLVGFSSRSRTAALTRRRSEIKEVMLEFAEGEVEVQRERMTVEGVLDFADSRKAVDLIGLTTKEDNEYKIIIEEGMDDLVRSYYGREVVVTGTYDPRDKKLLPTHIEPLRD